jgi:mRNA interferase HicA
LRRRREALATSIVRLGNKKSELPMHGHGKELGSGLVNKIKKDLGLK